MRRHAPLIKALQEAAGADAIATDEAARRHGAADLYSTGPLPVAVVKPDSPQAVAQAVAATTSQGYAVIPRGGGLSYTGGYVCGVEDSVLFDLTGLNRIVEISPQDMIVVAEAGVTWKQLYDSLKPHGLRLPFFGTFSGAGATIGGGLSHGALFFGSARYGSAADIALGLEVATANGALLRTGQWALRTASRPVLRNFGPDLTGLFLHDGGAFGLKTRASLRLVRTPAVTAFASFAFGTFADAALALSEIARAGLAEDVFVLDAASAVNAAQGERTMAHASACTLHCVMAASCQAAVDADQSAARTIAIGRGGVPIDDSLPRIARAEPFPNLNAVLGHEGARWAALNAKVAHSDGVALIDAHRKLIAGHAAAMTQLGVSVTYLLSALGTQGFSFESVFHWRDEWLPLHRARLDPQVLRGYREPPANPAAKALVDMLRSETVALFREFGAASNQVGRTYPYVEVLDAGPAELLRGLKSLLDPQARMNPGVLGLGGE